MGAHADLTSTPERELPSCLLRDAAEDRAEAREIGVTHGSDCAHDHRYQAGGVSYRCCGASHEGRPEDGVGCYHPAADVDAYEQTLAAIQRREAEAVAHVAAARWPNADEDDGALAMLACDAAARAHEEACFDDPMTLAQRATLLDAARSLVALALQVAGGVQ